MSKNKLFIKKGDTVQVISGDDRGKKGKVLSVNPDKSKITVDGINVAKKHQKPKKAGQQGGIITHLLPLNVSKAMVICDKCGKPTRANKKVLEDGSRVRACVNCGEALN